MTDNEHPTDPLGDELRTALRAEAASIRPRDRYAEIRSRLGEPTRGRLQWVAPIGIAAALAAIAVVIWSAAGTEHTASSAEPGPAGSSTIPTNGAAQLGPVPGSAPGSAAEATASPKAVTTTQPAPPTEIPAPGPEASAPPSADLTERYGPDGGAPAATGQAATGQAATGQAATTDRATERALTIDGPMPDSVIERGDAVLVYGSAATIEARLTWALDRDGTQAASGYLHTAPDHDGAFTLQLGSLEPGSYQVRIWNPTGPAAGRTASTDFRVVDPPVAGGQDGRVDGADDVDSATSAPATVAADGPGTAPTSVASATDAPIVIAEPAAGTALAGPADVRLVGTASVFSGSLVWALERGGTQVASGYTTASAGAPAVGTYAVDLGTLDPGRYTVGVWTESAKDGSVQHLVESTFTVQ